MLYTTYLGLSLYERHTHGSKGIIWNERLFQNDKISIANLATNVEWHDNPFALLNTVTNIMTPFKISEIYMITTVNNIP